MTFQSQSSRALSKALTIASKCIAPRNTLAILDNVLLTQGDNGKFYFTTATADSQLTIPAPLVLLDGKFTAPVALPVGGIVSYLSSLPECTINITINSNKTFTLDYCCGTENKEKTGKVVLPYFDGVDFPCMDNADSENITHISLPVSLFNRAIEQASIITDHNDLYPVLNSLCIDVAEDISQVFLVATEGRTLVKFTHSNDPKNGGSDFWRNGRPSKIIISNQYFRTLTAFSAFEEVSIESNGNHIRISSGDTVFVCKSLEGVYPNYNRVIPSDKKYLIYLDKKELVAAVKRASIFSNTNKCVKLIKDGNIVNVSTENIDAATSVDDQVFLAPSTQCEDGFTIGFNSDRFLSCLNAIENDAVCLRLISPTQPIVVTADEPSPIVLTLCAPMLLR